MHGINKKELEILLILLLG